MFRACRIYPLTHPSIRLLNEPCQYSFPFLLLQLLSLTSVIYDAFGFTAYVIGMHEKQAPAYFSRIEFQKQSLGVQVASQISLFWGLIKT